MSEKNPGPWRKANPGVMGAQAMTPRHTRDEVESVMERALRAPSWPDCLAFIHEALAILRAPETQERGWQDLRACLVGLLAIPGVREVAQASVFGSIVYAADEAIAKFPSPPRADGGQQVTAPDSIHCPKCGGRAKGPQYQPPTFPLYKDSLKYACRCGYVQYEPTKDTTEDR